MLRITGMFVGLLVVGCGGDSGGGGSDTGLPINGEPAQTLVCVEDEFLLAGTIDGEQVSVRDQVDGYAWIQGQTPNTFSADMRGGGRVNLQWPELVADGAMTQASGTMEMPPGGPRAGETLNAATGSLKKFDEGVTFGLSQLSLSVQCITDPCPAEDVMGDLSGCVHFHHF